MGKKYRVIFRTTKYTFKKNAEFNRHWIKTNDDDREEYYRWIITELVCTCPHKEAHCKHKAAVLFVLRDIITQPRDNRKLKEPINSILDRISWDELAGFVRDLADWDRDFREELRVRFAFANSEKWNHCPITKPHTISIELNFSENQMKRIRAGIVPKEMEDKWFAFYENDVLYFYRSWTGFGIYEVPFERQGDKYVVSVFRVENNKDIYRREDDEEDKRKIYFLIYGMILGEHVPLDVSGKDGILGAWSPFGRAILGSGTMAGDQKQRQTKL